MFYFVWCGKAGYDNALALWSLFEQAIPPFNNYLQGMKLNVGRQLQQHMLSLL